MDEDCFAASSGPDGSERVEEMDFVLQVQRLGRHAAMAVCSHQPASKASRVTFSLARKRLYRTISDQ